MRVMESSMLTFKIDYKESKIVKSRTPACKQIQCFSFLIELLIDILIIFTRTNICNTDANYAHICPFNSGKYVRM